MGRSRWKGKRKMAFIKNIDHETVLNLADQIHAEPGQIVSKTLAQNKAVSLTLFAFSKGEEISHYCVGVYPDGISMPKNGRINLIFYI